MCNGLSSYSFDQIGNRVEVQTPDEPDPVSYLTNALNQYTAIGAAAPPPPVSPSHDDDGNLINDGKGAIFEWRKGTAHTFCGQQHKRKKCGLTLLPKVWADPFTLVEIVHGMRRYKTRL